MQSEAEYPVGGRDIELDAMTSSKSEEEDRDEEEREEVVIEDDDSQHHGDELDLESGRSADDLDDLDEEENLRVPPVCMSFHNISFSVKISKGPLADGLRGLPAKLCGGGEKKKLWTHETKHILQPMSGHFLPGRLVAIMGPSGAVDCGWLAH
jgi:ABC-type multidrug transport system fused ATPase/permease subunit